MSTGSIDQVATAAWAERCTLHAHPDPKPCRACCYVCNSRCDCECGCPATLQPHATVIDGRNQ